jgi:hypothetical protein
VAEYCEHGKNISDEHICNSVCHQLHTGYFLGLLLEAEDGGTMFLRDTDIPTKLRGITYQKIVASIDIAVRTTNPT